MCDLFGDEYQKDLKNAYLSCVGIEKLRDKKILITGATGLIGSFIVDMLVYANEEYHLGIKIGAASRSIESINKRFLFPDGKIHKFIQNVCDEWKNDFAPDYIIHLAGFGHPSAFQDNPVGTMLTHIQGTTNMLEYAKNNHSRVLYVSTGEIYGQLDCGQKAFSENQSGFVDPMRPRSCYPTAKRAAECLCASYHQQYGVDVLVARPSHIYGGRMADADNRASAQFVRSAALGKNIVLNSAGNQLRSYTYIADAASAIITVLINGITGEAYNISNSNSVITIAGFAEKIAKVFGVNVTFKNPDDRERAMLSPVSFQVMDDEKLRKLGWQGMYDMDEGARRVKQLYC